MRRLRVDLDILELSMSTRSSQFLEEREPYLDLVTGVVVDAVEEDGDLQEGEISLDEAEADPDRFQPIPVLESADDNEMLRAFLASDWTEDEELRDAAAAAYAGSVGRWRRSITGNRQILHAWNDFEAKTIHQRAIEFLAELGIEPIGKDEDVQS